MKKVRYRYFAVLGGVALLLVLLVILFTCRRERVSAADPSDGRETTHSVTGEGGTDFDAPTETDSADTTETTENTPPESNTEEVTAAPVTLTAEEAKALLSAALEKEIGQASTVVRLSKNGEVYAEKTIIRKGNNFYVEITEEGDTERITVMGDRGYYLLSKPKDFPPVDQRFVMTMTEGEREALYEAYIGEQGLSLGVDPSLIGELLNSTLGGTRYHDGSVSLTCTGLDGSLMEAVFGASVAGAGLGFEFTLDKEVRVTYLRGIVTLPSGSTGGSATATLETEVDYTPAAIALPADAAAYAPTTYGEIFGVQLPEADPAEAAAAGLPLDKDRYTLMGGTYVSDLSAEYAFLTAYPHCYAGKGFTLYGIMARDGHGQLVLSLGDGMELAVVSVGVTIPMEGSYVKLTAVYEQVAEGYDHTCYAMRISACEVLQEAEGPNGGRLLYVTSAALNVRSTADASGTDNIIGSFSKGDLVEVLEERGDGWYRVVYNGRSGYVNGRYLSETRP